jgi:type VI secretion system secreted protein Hcp
MRKMGDDPLDFMKIKMSPVLVSSIDSGGSEGDESFTETIGLNFGKVEITYTPQKEDGSPDADIIVTWDIEAGTT